MSGWRVILPVSELPEAFESTPPVLRMKCRTVEVMRDSDPAVGRTEWSAVFDDIYGTSSVTLRGDGGCPYQVGFLYRVTLHVVPVFQVAND